MRVAGSMPGRKSLGLSGSAFTSGMQRINRRRYSPQREAVLILVLFLLLIVVLLYFS